MPRVDRIERHIKQTEGFEVRFLHPNGEDVRGDLVLRVARYDYKRRSPGSTSVTGWIRTRFSPRYPGYSAKVLLGDGSTAHGRTVLQTVRDSYP